MSDVSCNMRKNFIKFNELQSGNKSIDYIRSFYLFIFQSDPSTSFLRAARAGQLEKVLEYLESGVDINASNAVSSSLIRLNDLVY